MLANSLLLWFVSCGDLIPDRGRFKSTAATLGARASCALFSASANSVFFSPVSQAPASWQWQLMDHVFCKQQGILQPRRWMRVARPSLPPQHAAGTSKRRTYHFLRHVWWSFSGDTALAAACSKRGTTEQHNKLVKKRRPKHGNRREARRAGRHPSFNGVDESATLFNTDHRRFL